MTRRWKVLLCGYYGMGNLGDELLASASIALLEKCGVARDKIAMLCGSPSFCGKVHGVAVADRWNMRSVLAALASSESLLLGGGGIFQDSSSLSSPLYYWLVIRAARLLGCRVWAVGQSIGPLASGLSRLLARNAFGSCGAVSVRDAHSELFLPGKCSLTDDLVLSLPSCASVTTVRNRFLVNFRPCGGLEYEAAKALSMLQLPLGMKVIGVAMDQADAELMEKMTRENLLSLHELVAPSSDKVEELFASGVAAFGMRLHFGVLALRSGVPCSLVPYDPKVSDFAKRWGAPIWDGGSLLWPSEWRRRDELSAVGAKIFDDFYACFYKVMNSRM